MKETIIIDKVGELFATLKKYINYNKRDDFEEKTEKLFIDILLLKTKPILLGIVYHPPDQSEFLKDFNEAILNARTFPAKKFIF